MSDLDDSDCDYDNSAAAAVKRGRGRPRGRGRGSRGNSSGSGTRGRGRGRGRGISTKFGRDLQPLGLGDDHCYDEEEALNIHNMQRDQDKTLEYQSDMEEDGEEEIEEVHEDFEDDDENEEDRRALCPVPRAKNNANARRGRKRNIEITYSNEEITKMLDILKERTGFDLAPFRPQSYISHNNIAQGVRDQIGDYQYIFDKYGKEICIQVIGYDSCMADLYTQHLMRTLYRCGVERVENLQKINPEFIFKNITSNFKELVPPFIVKLIENGETDKLTLILAGFILFGLAKLEEWRYLKLKYLEKAEQLMDSIDYFIKKKAELVEAFMDEREKCFNKLQHFDESNIWGTRPLRKSFEPPYFKYMNESAVIGIDFTNPRLNQAFFHRNQQKWTNKDISNLRLAIKETIVSTLKFDIQIAAVQSLVTCQDELQKHEEREMNGGAGAGSANPHIQMLNELDSLRKTGDGKKKPGRPKNMKKYDVYRGSGTKFLCNIPLEKEKDSDESGPAFRVDIIVTPKSIEVWKKEELKKIRKMSYAELTHCARSRINWIQVSNKMIFKTRKRRSEDDCFLAWKHEADSEINSTRWKLIETRRLREITENLISRGIQLTGNMWMEIAMELNTNRTEYQCFYRYKNKILSKDHFKMNWENHMDTKVLNLIVKTEARWVNVALSCGDSKATKKQIQERWKKNLNPILKAGAFSRVEDALLLLTIEKLKPLINREGHFASVMAYLPWRFETTWRDRASNLFSDWIVPWTLEEDKKLIKYAKEHKNNWSLISTKFISFKNRKGCLTRFKILQKQIGEDKRFQTLEEYHEMYSMTRYNVFQYRHLSEIVILLKKILPLPRLKFYGLERDRQPSETDLRTFIQSFDRDIMVQTIQSLEKYENERQEYWREWHEQYGQKKRTFDRRTFHRDSAKSVASAIHIRGLQLKAKESVTNLTQFQKDVYMFYGRFTKTKPLKPNAKRPYLPEADMLKRFPKIIDIVVQDDLEEIDEDVAEEFWENFDKVRDAGGKKKRGRPRKRFCE